MILQRIQKHRGISLIEVVFAITILAGAIIFIIPGLQAGIVSSKDSDEIAAATDLAQMQIEKVKNLAGIIALDVDGNLTYSGYANVNPISRRTFAIAEDPSKRFEYQQDVEPKDNDTYRLVEVKVYLKGKGVPVATQSTYIVGDGI